MTALGIGLISIGILFFLIGTSVWICVSILGMGLISLTVFTDFSALGVMANTVWNSLNSPTMLALPLFVWMGEIMFHSGLTTRLFEGLTPLMNRVPGRLLHVTTISCALFAAVCGSSAATTATIGRITVPEMLKRNYDKGVACGILAGAGTLGFMIPPSTVMLIYGLSANVSVGRLFIAGIIPGLMIALMFFLVVAVRCIINPKLAPSDGTHYTLGQTLKSLLKIVPTFLLILFILGSIYLGWATTTESASIGVLGALIIALCYKELNWKTFVQSIKEGLKTSVMIMLIVSCASFLSVVVGYLGISAQLTAYIGGLGLGKYMLILIFFFLYLMLGCLLDGGSMIVLTLPLALPLIKQAGWDPLWFGIFLVMLIEIAQLTPPVGFNLFVINSIAKEDILTVARWAMPSFVILCLAVLLLVLFPKIALFLPTFMMG